MSIKNNQELQDEIEYIKNMAQKGDNTPLNIGKALFWAGVCFGLAAIGQYVFMLKIFNVNMGVAIAIDWVSAGVIYGLLMAALNPKSIQISEISSTNRAARAAWIAIAFAILIYTLCAFIISTISQNIVLLPYTLAPFVLVLYGIGWLISSYMSGKSWLKMIGFGCFLGAIFVSFFVNKPEQLIVYAICLLLFAVLPGYKLDKETR